MHIPHLFREGFNPWDEYTMKGFKLFTEPLVLSVPIIAVLEIDVAPVEVNVILLRIFFPFQFSTNLFFNLCLAPLQPVKVRFPMNAPHRETDTDISFIPACASIEVKT